jgi:type VI secretion system protein ImpL
VRRRYLDDYIRTWDEFLADIRLVAPANLGQTVQLVRILSGADSPLKRLLTAVAKETSLAEGDGSLKDTVTKAATEAVVDTTKKMLGKILGDAGPKVDPAASKKPESVVDEHFKALRALAAAPPGGGAAPIDDVINSLKEVFTQLVAMEDAVRRGEPVAPPAGAGRLRAMAEQLPPPTREVLLATASATTREGSKESLETVLKAVRSASEFCRKAVAGRYPLVKGSATEATIDDFSRVFAPGGDLDEVFQKHVASLVDTSGAAWKPRSKEGPALPAGVIAQFQRAAVIRDAFFRPGSKAPAANAELRLVSMDERITHVTLDMDNQVMRFDRVAALAVKIVWPSQRAGGLVRMQAYPSGTALSGEGSWALFRLVERGNPQPGTQADRLQLTYNLGGTPVVFELRAASFYNPFRLRALEEFQCPSG